MFFSGMLQNFVVVAEGFGASQWSRLSKKQLTGLSAGSK
jgi:hypothetical protein